MKFNSYLLVLRRLVGFCYTSFFFLTFLIFYKVNLYLFQIISLQHKLLNLIIKP